MTQKPAHTGLPPALYTPSVVAPIEATGNENPLPSPVIIDWSYWQKRRPLVLELNEDVPPYLMLPEVHQVLDEAKELELHFLINTLWHTGARITEALQMTRESFGIDTVRNSYVILSTLKRGRGRPKKNGEGRPPKRLVPLVDPAYLQEAERYLATVKPKKNEPIFSFDRFALDYRLKGIQQHLALPIKALSAHTFRHSFAVNALVQGRGIRTIQGWLGHKDLRSTEIYLKVLSGETHHLMYGMLF